MKTLITLLVLKFLLPKIDPYINKITMYKLILYYLIGLVVVASIFGLLGMGEFEPVPIILSSIIVPFVCYITNAFFSKIFKVPTNIESPLITGLILALILIPVNSPSEIFYLTLVSILAIASKYIFTIERMHIFNPVAAGVFMLPLVTNQSAIWWIGVPAMIPFVALGGFLVVRKIRREDMILSFIIAAITATVIISILSGQDVLKDLKILLFASPLFFFAFTMLTEPLTTPPTKTLRSLYGVLVGILISLPFTIGSFYFTPESSLLIANLLLFFINPRKKLILTLKEKVRLAPDIMDFVFTTNKKISFKPGQYVEWTIPHKRPDSRGNRRYFTIASSPTEEEIHLGVRFYPNGSSLKKTLEVLDNEKPIAVGGLAGDFTLPKQKDRKLLFIAGGIGVTPFRSMIKYLLDINEKRDIILLYSVKTKKDIVYRDVFEKADEDFGIRPVYLVSEEKITQNDAPYFFEGEVTEKVLKQFVPGLTNRLIFISGKNELVRKIEKIAKRMGVKQKNIKKDYFPGY